MDENKNKRRWLHRLHKKKTVSKKATSVFKNTLEQKKIDEILDKISTSGYESLTKSEKDYLFQAGKK